MKINFKRFNLIITPFIALGGILLGVINYCNNSSVAKKMYELQMKTYSSQLDISNISKGRIECSFKGPIINLQEVELYFTIKNISDRTIQLMGFITTDTLTTNKILRKKLLSNSLGNAHIDYFPDFTKETFPPGDSSRVKLKFPIRNRVINDSYFHVIALYENDIGGLYETYFIQKISYEFDKLIARERIRYDKNKKVLLIPKVVNVSSTEFSQDYYTYSLDEKTIIDYYLDEIFDIKD